MTEPIIVPDRTQPSNNQQTIQAIGQSFDLYEWTGSGPGYLHVHYADDEAWHVLGRWNFVAQSVCRGKQA